MNYFRKRRERQAKSNSGIYCPASNRSKIQYETKEKADHAVQYDNGGLVNNPPLSLKNYGLKLFGLDKSE